MSTAIATREPDRIALAPAVEQALLHGDLKALSVEHRLEFYHARCRASGLNPMAKPFAYVQLNGKVVLYALKECAEQLNHIHGISHTVSGIICDDKKGVIEVMCEAKTREGRTTFEIGAVSIDGLRGEALCNAKMKAVTKAKRRATLSLCGLGDVIDESELDTIRTIPCNDKGTPIAVDNGTGHASGKYCSDEEAEACIKAIDGYRMTRNQMWLDRWTGKDGVIPERLGELCPRIYQADNHCAKWAIAAGLIKPESMDETGLKPNQLGKLTGIVYKSTPNKLKNELKRYMDELERVALQKLQKDHPELFEAADAPAGDTTDDEILGDMEGVE